MIELNGVQRHYSTGGQRVTALAAVDLEIHRGEYVAITGASGSGKSTLLNILGCLDRPSQGSYRLDGEDTAALDDEALSRMRNQRIGFVFQSFHLLPRLSVLENVMLPARFAGRLHDPLIEQRARQLLQRVGLGERLEHRPQELSGGQMQRAAIARALVMQPSLLLADEPTGNLDSRSARAVLELIDELHRGGQTVVLVTHDHDIAGHAPREVRLRDGQVELDRRAAEVHDALA
ncbi:ABC transporter ATP-binding protein [Pseudomarimonas arenosa]|uniref:ABC transporter ATP-binding protein n=1 Tax=Pseudomarimonas arenosa TaxID=2774145 RepID=A0AAW3ZN66_9GAMM|nr:ABC transporter ATP-binding protein [Pseudomarimonas arenosa]MBD8525741.1 ABC transporter ATP-binding protein [Pseudomarimonas arenosa]